MSENWENMMVPIPKRIKVKGSVPCLKTLMCFNVLKTQRKYLNCETSIPILIRLF